jgi:HEAT repeat protein
MNLDEKKRINRGKRGQISPEDLKPYLNSSTECLVGLLNADDPQKRTISASILGKRQSEDGLIHLVPALKREEALYSRIAISEALSEIGEPAVGPVISLLGEIGKNQERELPKKYFNKKSFPLARDIAARTLVKLGKPATPQIIKILKTGDSFKVQQAIDAIGGIAAKTGDKRGLKPLLNILQLSLQENNKVTIWKIVRALSGFRNCEDAVNPLISVINSEKENRDGFPIVWESSRSLGQVGVKNSQIINLLLDLSQHENSQINKASEIALKQLEEQ